MRIIIYQNLKINQLALVNMKKQTTVQIGIKKIKDLAFSVNEDVEIGEKTGIQIKHNLKFSKAEKTIEFIMDIGFLTKEEGITFMSSRISNLFFVPALNKYENPKVANTFDLPNGLLVTIVSISITHARALISRNAGSTKFADIYLPIINPTEFTQNLFKISNL